MNERTHTKEASHSVWLLTSGDGSDGDEWHVHSIHETEAGALNAKVEYERMRTRPDKSTYQFRANVEEWPVEGEKIDG